MMKHGNHLLFVGVIAFAITAVGAATGARPYTLHDAPPDASGSPNDNASPGMQPTRGRPHYAWHNSYKAVVDQTAAVVQGTVTDIKESYTDREGPRTLVTLERLKTLWGDFRPPSVVLKVFGGPVPGRRGRVDEVHTPTFARGKTYLVFLSNRDWRLSPVTARQYFIVERVRGKDILVMPDGRAVYGIDNAVGPVGQFPVYRIPDKIDENYVPRVEARVTAQAVSRAYSPGEFVAALKLWARRNNVSVSGSFNDQPFDTGNWRVVRAAPEKYTEGSERERRLQFAPPAGRRTPPARDNKACWDREEASDADPRDRSKLCAQGGDK